MMLQKMNGYYAPIKSAYDNGLMSGVSDTEFAPDTDITRGMFITVLHRIDGETKSDVDYTFTDVNENDYFSMLSLGAVRIILFQVTATQSLLQTII